jgi:hypothetical protein
MPALDRRSVLAIDAITAWGAPHAMASDTATIAAVTRGRTQDDRIREAFARAFVKADGAAGNGGHCSYIPALRLGLVPDAWRANTDSTFWNGYPGL